MSIRTLNPNHPVSQAVDGQWLKILAIYMHSRGLTEVVISVGDIERTPPDIAIAVQELHDGLHVHVMSTADGEALARKEGGLPT